MYQPNVVAQAIMRYKDGHQVIIEVCSDAGYQDFYRWYRQSAGPRLYIRSSNREMKASPTLESVVAAQMRAFGKSIASHEIIIINPDEYNVLLNCPSSDLPGGGPATSHGGRLPSWTEHRESLPVGYLSLARKFEIATGR